MDLHAIRTELRRRLLTVHHTVYDVPSLSPTTPCLEVGWPVTIDWEQGQTFCPGGVFIELPVMASVGRGEVQTGLHELETWVSTDHVNSVRNALLTKPDPADPDPPWRSLAVPEATNWRHENEGYTVDFRLEIYA